MPYSERYVSAVASIVTVVSDDNALEVLYLPAIEVVKFNTSARFEVPLPSIIVALLIENLLVSSSKLASIPALANLVIKSSMVSSLVIETVTVFPRTLNSAVTLPPFPFNPKVPRVVSLFANIVVVSS